MGEWIVAIHSPNMNTIRSTFSKGTLNFATYSNCCQVKILQAVISHTLPSHSQTQHLLVLQQDLMKSKKKENVLLVHHLTLQIILNISSEF